MINKELEPYLAELRAAIDDAKRIQGNDCAQTVPAIKAIKRSAAAATEALAALNARFNVDSDKELFKATVRELRAEYQRVRDLIEVNRWVRP